MGNKQQLQLNNETLASILSNVLGLPSQESLKHGAYVWKKSTQTLSYENPRFTVGSRTDKRLLPITSDSFDTSLINEEFFDGFSILINTGKETQYQFSYQDGTLYLLPPNTQVNSVYEVDYSPSTATFTCNPSGSGGGFALDNTFGIASYVGVKTIEYHQFLDFTVSDSPTAYPDGGMQGGYWYEKVGEIDPTLFGCTKCAVDNFTFSERTHASSTWVNHSLGEIPKISFVISESSLSSKVQYDLYFSALWKVPFIGDNSTEEYCEALPVIWGTSNFTANAGQGIYSNYLTYEAIRIYGKDSYYVSGVEYTLITMA